MIFTKFENINLNVKAWIKWQDFQIVIAWYQTQHWNLAAFKDALCVYICWKQHDEKSKEWPYYLIAFILPYGIFKLGLMSRYLY